MKGILRKTLLVGMSSLMLVGCVNQSFVKDLLQTASVGYCVQLPRKDDMVMFSLYDGGHYNDKQEVVYSFKFAKDQKVEYYTLSGEFAGKKVADASFYDDYSVRLTITGTSTTGSSGVVFGTLTIDQAAFSYVEDQYKGAKISVTIALGDEGGRAERQY